MKKALALILVLVLALGMSSVAFAAKEVTVNKNASANPNWAAGGTLASALETDITGDIIDTGDLFVQEGYTYNIWLMATNFGIGTATRAGLNNDGTPKANFIGSTLTTAEIKASKMSVRVRASKGSQVIDEVVIESDKNGKDSRIEVKFVETLASNNPDGVDFDFRVYLVVDGKTWNSDDMAVRFSGNYANECPDDVDSSYDYFDFSGGVILKPTEFIRRLDGDLGQGVTVDMRALKNAKYWGIADQDTTDADQDIMVKYATIDAVYHVQQIGLANVANYVTLGDADPSSYVYDGELNYLGRANAQLPLVGTYYLSSAELDVDTEPEDEDEGEEDEDYDPDDNSEGGGDDLYPSNPHDNPGTGR